MSTRREMVHGPGRPTALRTFSLGTSTPQYRGKLPLSPPETERSALTRNVDYESPETEKAKEDVHPRNLRRAPSIQYNHNGAVGGRPQPQRTSRWLIVVTPPTTLNTQPVLGHTLAMGPPGRYQSGILMPLFPTMYGQLAAIAREFSLPSIAGVCLYLHVQEPNIGINPRISDEAWQLLWSPYFTAAEEAALPMPSGPPICGRIEFDVDTRKARWYESWVNGQERPVVLEASIPPSVAQTMRGWYQDHREATQGDTETSLDQLSTSRKSKHVPRPLALSGNYENLSRPPQKHRAVVSHDNDGTDLVASKLVSRRLSPVTQATETASTKQRDLDVLVRNWRATTPHAIVNPSVAPAGESVPDTYDFSELDMDDYDWTMSSVGPPADWPQSPIFASPLPSVDLCGRMVGSVALTPSVASSFGPNDSMTTPTWSNVSRYPSPDIAGRLMEDSPPTPTTATSWGAPLSWPASPSVIYYAESPDVAARCFGTRPNTPSTATSWGVPEVWPSSPVEITRPATPDVGERNSTEVERHSPYQLVWPFLDTNSAPYSLVWPFLDTNRGKPCEYVRPFFVGDNSTRGNATTHQTNFKVSPPTRSAYGQKIGHALRSETTPSSFGWPFFTADQSIPRAISINLTGVYPYLYIYPHVYPNLIIYPERSDPSAGYSNLQKSLPSERVSARYACELLSPPKVPTMVQATSARVDVTSLLTTSKPATAFGLATSSSIQVPNSAGYPYFNLYPPVYPFVTPYPSRQDVPIEPLSKQPPPSSTQSVSLVPCYPEFDLYPAGYPSLIIYPPVKLAVAAKEPKDDSVAPVQSLRLASAYPILNIYPTVYPFLEIYPSFEAPRTPKEERQEPKMNLRLGSYYPELVIYPPVYPTLDIYPSFKGVEEKKVAKLEPIVTLLPSVYPNLTIYPPTYPCLEIYPTMQTRPRQANRQPPHSPSLDKRLPSFYPFLEIYAPQYPHLQIYPITKGPVSLAPAEWRPADLASSTPTSVASVRLEARYPAFNLYPPQYPYFDIYPSVPSTRAEPTTIHQRQALSISIRISESVALVSPPMSPLSPRQRGRRGSNQWTANGFISPATRLRRGSINKFDKCEVPALTPSRKVIVRPILRHRKSHTDLYNEVKDQVIALVEAKVNATRREIASSPVVAPAHTTIRKLSSARMDGVASSLSRSKSLTTAGPPVPALPSELRHKVSTSSLKVMPGALSAIGASAFAVASAVSNRDASL